MNPLKTTWLEVAGLLFTILVFIFIDALFPLGTAFWGGLACGFWFPLAWKLNTLLAKAEERERKIEEAEKRFDSLYKDLTKILEGGE